MSFNQFKKKKNRTSPLDLVTLEIVGPSSSHTAGVMLIARKVLEHSGSIRHARLILYNSLADTGDAHMTKSALVAGLLGWDENDPRIPFSFRYAEDAGMKIHWFHRRDEHMHPNTVMAEIVDGKEQKHFFEGISVGGGRIKFKRIQEIPMYNHNNHDNHDNHNTPKKHGRPNNRNIHISNHKNHIANHNNNNNAKDR
jgi:L-serine dehydratase